MKIRLVIAAVASLGLIAPAAAAPSAGPASFAQRPRVMLRLLAKVTALRIRQGVRSGELTPAELAQIRGDLVKFREEALLMRQAGTPLTAAQHVQLRQDWKHISAEIYQLKHNDVRTSEATR
jgi:hypothetical protein